MKVLFYRVPRDRPSVPVTPFTDHFWDYRENWHPPSIGLVPGSEKVYFGPLPNLPFVKPQGHPDLWLNGLDYERWASGGYSTDEPCFDLIQGGAFDSAYHSDFDVDPF